MSPSTWSRPRNGVFRFFVPGLSARRLHQKTFSSVAI
uniref:Uncharacterized protein n=1 Tax=Rhizophora mucronata TaxID=61149 RepID=A0A2P2NIB6_RHIMU